MVLLIVGSILLTIVGAVQGKDATGLLPLVAMIVLFKSLPFAAALHLIAALRCKPRSTFVGLGLGYLTVYVAIWMCWRH